MGRFHKSKFIFFLHLLSKTFYFILFLKLVNISCRSSCTFFPSGNLFLTGVSFEKLRAEKERKLEKIECHVPFIFRNTVRDRKQKKYDEKEKSSSVRCRFSVVVFLWI